MVSDGLAAPLITASRFPALHGFSTRQGGVSTGVYSSLNLGWTQGDAPEHVGENFKRLAQAGNFPLERLHTVSQVHGDGVRQASGSAAHPTHPDGEADALWTGDPGAVVGVKTADCVPLLLAAPRAGRVAAIHAGWRGTLASIAARAMDRLQAEGARPDGIWAALGPSIRRCCYEVSAELAETFAARFGEGVVERRPGRGPHLDLVACVQTTLRQMGLPADQLEVVDGCTACEPERFFSHRRDAARHHGAKGLHLSFVACAAP